MGAAGFVVGCVVGSIVGFVVGMPLDCVVGFVVGCVVGNVGSVNVKCNERKECRCTDTQTHTIK